MNIEHLVLMAYLAAVVALVAAIVREDVRG